MTDQYLPCSWRCSCSHLGPAAKSQVRGREHECSPSAPRAGAHWVPAHQLSKWESLKVTPPSLPSDLPWAGVISHNPCLEFLCSSLSPRAAQGSVPATAGWVCSTSPANRSSPGVACSLPLALTQLFCHHFVCSYSRHIYPNHTCYWPRQNVTCLSKVKFHLFFHRLSWLKPWRGTCRWQPHFVTEFPPHSYNFVKLLLVDYRSTILLFCWPV